MKTRLVSLDQFRGLTIFLMILVNHPGAWDTTYPLLEHGWNGLTFADCVFPGFLFIMGTSIVLVNHKKVALEIDSIPYWSIFKRAGILILLGLIHDNIWGLDIWRIPGVLQRIGLCYALACLGYYSFKLIGFRIYAFVATIAFTFYYISFGEKGIFDLHTFIDKSIFGHLVYHKEDFFDPEGILSTFTSLITVWLGMEAGHILLQDAPKIKTFQTLSFASLASMGVYLLLMPFVLINKSIWTSSFVFITGFINFLVLSILYYLSEIKTYSNYFKPFQMIGMNAIAAYLGSEFLAHALNKWIRPDGVKFSKFCTLAIDSLLNSPYNSSLIYSLLYSSFWVLIATIAYKKNIFIKV
jgi:predicted acyltransferase